MDDYCDTRIIELTRGQVAIVDADDFPRLSKYKWFAHLNPSRGDFYAERWSPYENGKRHVIRMHREVLGLPRELVDSHGDHINHNTLDNRKSNLRVATQSQNMMNRGVFRNKKSRFKGVSWKNREQKWYVRIFVNKETITLGYFPADQEEAAGNAYAEAAKKYHGEYARTS